MRARSQLVIGSLVMVGLGATAHATPAVCAPKDADLELRVHDGAPVVCGGGACFAFDASGKPARMAAPAAAARLGAEVRDDAGKPSACAGTTCKPLGARLAAALAKARADGGALEVTASTDLKLVAFGAELWSRVADKKLAVKSPRGKMDATRIDAIGAIAIATWTDCLGPCELGTVVDARGHQVGKTIAPGIAVQLDDRRAIVLPQATQLFKLTVLDLRSGKPLATGDGELADFIVAARLDPHAVAIAWKRTEDGAWQVATIAVPDTGKPTINAARTVPGCP